MEEKCNVSTCDIYGAMNEIKGKYSSVVIFSLESEAKNFLKIKNEFDYLSNEQINRTLKELIENKVIRKNEKYELTPKGIELAKILRELEAWYLKYSINK